MEALSASSVIRCFTSRHFGGTSAIPMYPKQSARFVAETELSSPRQLNKRPGGGGTPRGMAPKNEPSMQAKSYSP
jgi:hypothetical protein